MKRLYCVAILILVCLYLLSGYAEEYVDVDTYTVDTQDDLTISDIIPDDSVWGMSQDDFQQAYPASYTSTKVGKSPALIESGLSVEGYNMNRFFVFKKGKLSKITYVLIDASDKSAVKDCAAELTSAMKSALGKEPTKKKGVSEWNKGAIQVGTAKLKNYTENNNVSVCIIFTGTEAKAEPTKAPKEKKATSKQSTSTQKRASIIPLDTFVDSFNYIAYIVKKADLVDTAHSISVNNIHNSIDGGVNDVLQYIYNDSELLQLAMPTGTNDIVQIMCIYSPYGHKDYSADYFWLFGEVCVAAGVIDEVTDVRDLINELDFTNHMNDGDMNELTKNGMSVGYWVTDGVGYCFYIETL